MKFYGALMASFLVTSAAVWGVETSQSPKVKNVLGGIAAPIPVLLYSDNSTMITDFSILPDHIQKQIRGIQSSKKFGNHDLTKSLAEILEHLKLSHPVAVLEGNISKDFKYTKVSLQYHKDKKSKGDCSNYPDAYVEMLANDAEKYDGAMVIPAEAKVYATKDKVPSKIFSEAQSAANKFVSADGPGLTFDFAVSDEKNSSVLVLFTAPAMGVSEYVIKCTKDAQCVYHSTIEGLSCGS